jgi:O-antigen ligase
MLKTPLRRFIFSSLLCGIVMLALSVVVWLDNSYNRGITFQADPTPIPWTDGPLLGVNAFNLHTEPDPQVVTRTLQLAHELGARYVRMQVPWEDIEIHGKGDFGDRRNDLDGDGQVDEVDAWAKYDRIVATARAFELELIMRVERPPLWAREQFNASEYFQEGLLRDGHSTGPPDNLADYGDFMHTIVSRYRDQVRFFQVWNEPNLMMEWNWQDPKPEDFAELLKVGATAARAANPDVVILFPSLSPTDGLDKRAPQSELEYLDGVYKAGGGDYFDIMSGQSYGLGQPPEEHRYVRIRWPNEWDWTWKRPIDTRNDVSRVVLLREVMERNGDHHKAIWIGEFGWNSAPESVPPERRFTWGQPVSEELKAHYLVGQMERARQEWPWMGVMNVWMLRWAGSVPDPADPTPYFAIVDQDFQPLPAYTALQHFAANPIAGVGYHHWSAFAKAEGDSQQLRFKGNKLALDLPEGGRYQVSIDGGAGTEVLGPGIIQIAQGLGDGEHTLMISPLAGSQAPKGVLVSRAAPLPWFWNSAPLLLVGLLMLTGALSMRALFELGEQLLIRSEPQRRRFLAWLQSKAGDRAMLLALLFAALIFYRAASDVPLTLLGLVLFGLLALIRPDLALRFVIFSAPLYFIPKGIWDENFAIRGDGLRLPMQELLLLITFGATAWRELSLRGFGASLRTLVAWRPSKEELKAFAPVALFALAGTLGVVVAQATGRGAALREWRWLIVEPLLLYALLIWQIGYSQVNRDAVGATRSERMLPFVYTLLASGAMVALVGLLQFCGLNLVPLFGSKVGFSEDSFFVEGVRRVNSLYGHPNNFGLFMDRIWPLAAALAVGGLQGWRTARESRFGTWILALTAALALGGVVVSFSKGSFLGAFAALILLVWWLPVPKRAQRMTLIGLGIALGLGALAAPFIGIERLNPFGESSNIRLSTWASAFAMLRDHPFFGVGLDQFLLLYPDYINPELAATNEINTAHPHNLLLDITLRMGWLGLAAFIWLIVGCFQRLNRLRHTADYRYLAVGLAAALLAAIVHGLVDSFYFWPDLAYAFWLTMALAWLGASDPDREEVS